MSRVDEALAVTGSGERNIVKMEDLKSQLEVSPPIMTLHLICITSSILLCSMEFARVEGGQEEGIIELLTLFE